MKMKRAGRVVGLILAVSLVLQFNIINTVWAVDPEPQSPPSKLRIEPQSPDEPAIGYNETLLSPLRIFGSVVSLPMFLVLEKA